jgi:hypothetical protein
LVRDDPKLLDDSGEVSKSNRVVVGLILGREIVSLFDGKLPRWSSASCVSRKRRKKKEEKLCI